ncbi:MAG: pseudouridine synthase [Anaerorhabdus sp.]
MKRAFQKDKGKEVIQKFKHEEKNEIRLNKYLSASGFSSRREADRIIEDKRVKIDGVLADVGATVNILQTVSVDDKVINLKKSHTYLILNKPKGITCTLEKDVEGNLYEFMNFNEHLFPVGRLDKDSTGLLILTSDGDIVNKILRSENRHDKEYIVRVNKVITNSFLKKMSEGVEITNTKNNTRVKTNKCQVSFINKHTFKIVLNQGFNRQIRRMCTGLNYHVEDLHRIRIMNIKIEDLKEGQYRYLTQEELDILNIEL